MYVYSFLNDPTAAELQQILDLYREAGWWPGGEDAPEVLKKIIAGSHCFLTVSYKDAVVGMGRALSDGASDAYVQDVTVSDAHRGKGVALTLVTKIVAKLQADGIDWIGLIAERNTKELYSKAGFAAMTQAIPMLLKQ